MGNKASYVYERGSINVEWSLSTLICCAALFLPIFDGGQSALGLLVDAIHSWQQHNSFALSLP